MKNDLQHITFGKVLNFFNIYVAAKSFSEQECLWSSRYVSTYFLHWIRELVSIVLQKGLCRKRRVVWILVNTLHSTGQCLLLKNVDIVLNLYLCFTFKVQNMCYGTHLKSIMQMYCDIRMMKNCSEIILYGNNNEATDITR